VWVEKTYSCLRWYLNVYYIICRRFAHISRLVLVQSRWLWNICWINDSQTCQTQTSVPYHVIDTLSKNYGIFHIKKVYSNEVWLFCWKGQGTKSLQQMLPRICFICCTERQFELPFPDPLQFLHLWTQTQMLLERFHPSPREAIFFTSYFTKNLCWISCTCTILSGFSKLLIKSFSLWTSRPERTLYAKFCLHYSVYYCSITILLGHSNLVSCIHFKFLLSILSYASLQMFSEYSFICLCY
jgi:hypothetical protein